MRLSVLISVTINLLVAGFLLVGAVGVAFFDWGFEGWAALTMVGAAKGAIVTGEKELDGV